jgi:hypothetical protein
MSTAVAITLHINKLHETRKTGKEASGEHMFGQEDGPVKKENQFHSEPGFPAPEKVCFAHEQPRERNK